MCCLSMKENNTVTVNWFAHVKSIYIKVAKEEDIQLYRLNSCNCELSYKFKILLLPLISDLIQALNTKARFLSSLFFIGGKQYSLV